MFKAVLSSSLIEVSRCNARYRLSEGTCLARSRVRPYPLSTASANGTREATEKGQGAGSIFFSTSLVARIPTLSRESSSLAWELTPASVGRSRRVHGQSSLAHSAEGVSGFPRELYATGISTSRSRPLTGTPSRSSTDAGRDGTSPVLSSSCLGNKEMCPLRQQYLLISVDELALDSVDRPDPVMELEHDSTWLS